MAETERARFPTLHQTVNDHPLVYLDSAATSQKPDVVLDALTSYYSTINSNVHRGAHSLSAAATEAFEAARDAVADLIRAPSRAEVIWTRNASEAINLVAWSWGTANLGPGDEIVVSVMEHHSNLVPWQLLAERTGAVVRAVPLTAGQEYDVGALQTLLDGGKVKLVACSHVSNVLACVNPVADITAAAHAAGALVLVDACQSVPHMPVDVTALGADWLVASAHKMCGPTGVGFLWGRTELLNAMPPFLGGGEMIQDVFLDHSTYTGLPHKFEAGTPAIAEVVALGAAVDYLNGLGMPTVAAWEAELGAYLYDRLTAFAQVTVYGPPTHRAALCAFNIEGVHPSDLATFLDLEGIAVRAGHHCAQPLHRELGVDGSARASLYLYNTRAEVDAFVDALVAATELLGVTLTPRVPAASA
ncbi:hypothetical protein BU14_0052s0070 [Porphyra umbilicalis]|uniref:cysteine desulfurase n=1 Tax=Porphyra umbilicalis TaxID=2786 RepID=A0A1X6PID7_PORUM|nr:hypothetical protein BU14_0052s0070 [Porphyra umbilicalis]|eukprot:OSX80458.1 hypothetical protein BU14_0052s0070 [Porphyra umbilicalis]